MVITEWTMPRLDGVELIRLIRALDLDRHTYVILLTARDTKADVVDGFLADPNDYLTSRLILANWRRGSLLATA